MDDIQPVGEQEGISLDELHIQVKKLDGLLNDRHPGLMTWNQALEDRLEEINRLINRALNKQEV